ncbi:MAG: sugar phosphate isomerase/epimerase [Cyclobacteriaceae bacterium]|nr:sugar phosphate isomerase/epimerase [Cyclobacteriaceae bacterium]
MEKRRQFLKTAGTFAAASLVLPFGCTTKKPAEAVAEQAAVEVTKKDIGLQLYTLRNEIQKDGVEATLKAVADKGYKWMEPFGYEGRKFLGKTPQEFAQICADLGMSVPSVHSVTEVSSSGGKDAILDQMKSAVEDGLPLVQNTALGSPEPEDRTSLEDYKRHIETWNKFGEVCKSAGIQFAYHNHDFEFIDFGGTKPYDLIMQNTDSDLVKFEMDLFWVAIAGQDPVEWINKEPGRFHLWHVKDMVSPENKYVIDGMDRFFAPVGQGTIDFKRIFEARGTSGMQYFFVEQDFTPVGISPLDTIGTSWNYLNTAALRLAFIQTNE